MQWPREVPVLTLPDAILFPGVFLPLYIFEPRYRRLLADALASHRMFAVAMQKPGCQRPIPAPIAGLGLIRVSVQKNDGSSCLILHGLARVGLERPVRYKPYRVQQIRCLPEDAADNVVVDALTAKVRDLVVERFHQGVPWPVQGPTGVPTVEPPGQADLLSPHSPKGFLDYLSALQNPGRVADLVSCTLLTGTRERQIILEAVNLESRLRWLIHFLMTDIRRHRKHPAA
jgi:Lon protease-like protein